jgi:hypothetical protein
MSDGNLYARGNILKSLCRTERAPLFVMICGDGTTVNALDQSAYQFRAVVVWCVGAYDLRIGDVHNNFNKNDDKVDRWALSSMAEIEQQKNCPTADAVEVGD